MPEAGNANKIDAEAAAWLARLDRGGLNPDESAAFERWLGGDVRRQGAYARLCAIRAAVADSVEMDMDAAPAARPSRRGLIWGGGLAATVAGLSVAGVSWFAASGTAYATGLGEVRMFPLQDGSSIVLNTQSRVRVWMNGDRRRAELERGEAIFTIAEQAERPFEVVAGPARLSSVGGAVAVRRLQGDQAVTVLMREGHAALETEGRSARALSHGDYVSTSDGDLAVRALSEEDVSRKAAWREGMIALQGETLREAAAEFARYNSTPIVIADPALGDRTVTGLFATNDPAGFARSVALSFGVRARIDSREIRLG